MHAIGRAYGRAHPTIRKLLLPSGGIYPVARRRSQLALTPNEKIPREGSLPANGILGQGVISNHERPNLGLGHMFQHDRRNVGHAQ